MNKQKKEEVKQALYDIGDAIQHFDEVIEGSSYTNELNQKIHEIAEALKIKL
ncbi:MAG: hypothetical protein Q7R33_05915 [Nitrosarchaeum sp.]|nr:hypothetical protein [Nitrosarchaeum sp.]